MSLSYQVEHLAWKQRVNQEVTRAATFAKTVPPSDVNSSVSTLDSPSRNLKKTHSQLIPEEHKTSTVNLAYTFGGFTPVKYAFKDPKATSFSVYGKGTGRNEGAAQTHGNGKRPETRGGEVYGKREGIKRPKSVASHQERYIQELKVLLSEERKKRENTELKLRLMASK